MTAPPRYATPRSPERATYGPAVAHLSAAMGNPLMPWQRTVNDVALEVNPDGSWAYRLVIVTVQRQAGKTTDIGAVKVHRVLTRKRAKVWLTAQSRQDARDTWLDVVDKVARSPLGQLLTVRRSNGSEALTSPGGSTFRVFAPSEDALHGTANEMVTVDEGWAFDAAQGAALEQAILPTFTTTGGQLWVVSTAGTAASEWLLGLVERGRAAVETGQRSVIAHFEWALAPELAPIVAAGLASDATEQARATAFRHVLEAHPANGHTLRLDALEQAAATMSPGDFLRAYGNVWSATSERTIPAHLWAACQRKGKWTPPDVGNVALAFDVAVDRSAAAIMGAWRDTPTGPIRWDVIDAHPGTSWVVGRMRQLDSTWRPMAKGWPGAGPAADVADELTRGGMDLTALKAADYATACMGTLAAITDRTLEHRGQSALEDAVASAGIRTLGDGGWAWSRRGSAGSIAPLTAGTVAGWLYDHRPTAKPAPVIVSRRRRPVTA